MSFRRKPKSRAKARLMEPGVRRTTFGSWRFPRRYPLHTCVRPWTQEFEVLAKPEWDKDGLFEYVCEENNRCPGGKCGAEK